MCFLGIAFLLQKKVLFVCYFLDKNVVFFCLQKVLFLSSKSAFFAYFLENSRTRTALQSSSNKFFCCVAWCAVSFMRHTLQSPWGCFTASVFATRFCRLERFLSGVFAGAIMEAVASKFATNDLRSELSSWGLGAWWKFSLCWLCWWIAMFNKQINQWPFP